MSGLNAGLRAHLQTAVTTTCRAWALTRKDGTVLGFTDHDGPLTFGGITFRADTGLSALAIQQTTGLSVDNTEALGALCDASIREEDIEAGRYDGAEIRAWLVNWHDVSQRHMQFRGTIGELRRSGGAFEAELRGLTDVLNRPLGRVYQKPCSAVLGDRACAFDTSTSGYSKDTRAAAIEERRVFHFDAFAGFDAGWFQFGRLVVLAGAAEGLSGMIKRDRMDGARRVIELWHPLRADVRLADLLRLEAGCDKRAETCRLKFQNLINYQGFPDIPGDDWSISDPSKAGSLNGGSRR
ncbi:hypothetical protein DC366_06735 [Pelagivirga sediminicola]|uniref:Bacteriophage phiJL001 Gp84 C-terminal domain-containing protein n=1 Tax=Pelagivirga sediminicola TaxID=2170575 RepID=A0A2T7G856_9RHOB|nr:DUF2163 domain-containing protein [Pelagivirga sediminicola]PVA10594.1 hypothetical protein DC366_06735 [Pelagivirga sediminicola]